MKNILLKLLVGSSLEKFLIDKLFVKEQEIIDLINAKVDIPGLTEQQEAAVIKTVYELIRTIITLLVK